MSHVENVKEKVTGRYVPRTSESQKGGSNGSASKATWGTDGGCQQGEMLRLQARFLTIQFVRMNLAASCSLFLEWSFLA